MASRFRIYIRIHIQFLAALFARTTHDLPESREPSQAASAVQSRLGWLEDLAQCDALAALPDTLDGAFDAGPPLEALGRAQT